MKMIEIENLKNSRLTKMRCKMSLTEIDRSINYNTIKNKIKRVR